MPKLIKSSTEKIFVCGNVVEYFHYSQPYYYNFPPRRKKYARSSERSMERREDSLNACRLRLRRLIVSQEGNYKEKPLFITFTFKRNETDVIEANSIWSLFIKRFNYYLSCKKHEKLEYVSVIEFQKRGAVHYHALFFNLGRVDFEILESLWGEGTTNTSVIRSIGGVAYYVGKYINKGFSDPRLRARKAYFSSRGLVRPVRFRNPQKCLTYLSDNDTLKISHQKAFSSSRLGEVIYKQLRPQNLHGKFKI